ncbi:transcriptional regulator [Rhizobium deserti]|uniref:Transcriptional regulator n=1 Tax=Rhizobium deserti TaxID=2547961 RepID=A0A4R5UMU1_9HYPH|nr:helix-turn-helix domain-containing protein [Rhizobium deserti]TDK39212.1 transcriptional regulator [Rhizobium deserti]
MKRKSFQEMDCPVAQTLERVGEQWSILILRDALRGLKRFDEFLRSLDVAPNMLARRLATLVEAGLLEKSRYCDRPLRYEYLLTDAGRDFQSVIHALIAYGNRHFTEGGHSVYILDTETGQAAEPVVVDRSSGELIREPRFRLGGDAVKSATDGA